MQLHGLRFFMYGKARPSQEKTDEKKANKKTDTSNKFSARGLE